MEKPWGYELIWARTPEYVGKILFVKAGEALSLQYHEHKDETMFLESGECRLEVGESEHALSSVPWKAGDAFHIPPKLRHRVTAITDCRIFEASTSQLDDVIRLEDRYGRRR